jgi:hypothetical protein
MSTDKNPMVSRLLHRKLTPPNDVSVSDRPTVGVVKDQSVTTHMSEKMIEDGSGTTDLNGGNVKEFPPGSRLSARRKEVGPVDR